MEFASSHSNSQRRRLTVQGIVQGVGFRPFVYSQALRWGLVGFVLNDSRGVTIEIEGPLQALDGFQQVLRKEAPPLARIDSLVTELVPLSHETAFVIVHSKTGAERRALISPDTSICDDCLRHTWRDRLAKTEPRVKVFLPHSRQATSRTDASPMREAPE